MDGGRGESCLADAVAGGHRDAAVMNEVVTNPVLPLGVTHPENVTAVAIEVVLVGVDDKPDEVRVQCRVVDCDVLGQVDLPLGQRVSRGCQSATRNMARSSSCFSLRCFSSLAKVWPDA